MEIHLLRPVRCVPLCMFVLFIGVFWASGAYSSAIEDLAKAAQKEGVLNFIDTAEFADPSFTKLLQEGIKKKYGVT